MSGIENGFAVMRWLEDGNRLSVHALKHVVEPKLPINSYKAGMCGESLFKGYPGTWKFRILAVGGRHLTWTGLIVFYKCICSCINCSFQRPFETYKK